MQNSNNDAIVSQSTLIGMHTTIIQSLLSSSSSSSSMQRQQQQQQLSLRENQQTITNTTRSNKYCSWLENNCPHCLAGGLVEVRYKENLSTSQKRISLVYSSNN
uniref:Uncharacterized protein n=1 Tax=Eucampia antarctica TaxID=49252 RepID=A0A7S2SGQ2_9STRA